MKRVVVLIPLYKESLDELELLAYRHNAEILKRYDIVGVYPEGMDLSFYRQLDLGVSFHAFGRRDFASVRRYNRLLISPRFYSAFSDYEYMLICHFDAWVFRDELGEWCDKGYDHIGAPFLDEFQGRTTALFPFLSRICLCKIGNGGFCLRKVATFLEIAKRYRWLSLVFFYNEDVFWTMLLPLVKRDYHVPSVEEALTFSVDGKGKRYVPDGDGRFPFSWHGCFKRLDRETLLRYLGS